jgi:putative hydrolase
VSDFGPLGPDDDPFKDVPFLGDLARMLQSQGGLRWDAARQFAVAIAAGGTSEPNVDPVDRIQLEELGRVAELHVAQTTGLATSHGTEPVRVTAVTRSTWAQQTLDDYQHLFDELAGAFDKAQQQAPDEHEDAGDPFAPLFRLMGPMMFGMAAASMVGHLAQRSLGPYTLPIPRPGNELGVIVSTLDHFGDQWSLPQDDLRLWICLNEIAYHTVLAVPHVRARIERDLRDYLGGFESDPGALESRLGGLDPSSLQSPEGLNEVLGDPEALLGIIQSPAQLALRPRIDAVVATVLGVVDHVVDEVGGRLLPAHTQIAEAFRRRRVEADPSDRFVERLLGLELSQAAYDRGQAFVSGVVERGGAEGLARLWTSERELPTPAEVDAPGLWLARIDLPD